MSPAQDSRPKGLSTTRDEARHVHSNSFILQDRPFRTSYAGANDLHQDVQRHVIRQAKLLLFNISVADAPLGSSGIL
jgi:hypothetical protein